MRICFLEGDMSRKGGTERMTALLANALSETHEVLVISRSMQGMHPGFELLPSVAHRALKPGRGKLAIPAQIREIRRILKEERIERVINVDTGMGIYGIFAAKGLKRCRVVTWEHANYYNNWNSRFFPALRRVAACCSDAFVVLTERDKQNYAKNIPGCAPLHVIHNPAAIKAHRYDEDAKLILSAGQLLPIKQYEKAIEAAAKVLPLHPEWRWIICGEGPERGKLEAMIQAYGLTERVFLPGNAEDMDAWYQKAAVFVLTSKMEGLPMVLLEAKSMGVPIVSFDIMTGPSDIVSDSVNGFLVPQDDVDGLAEKLLLLMEDPTLRKKYSDHAQIGMERFAWEHILEQWETLLAGL